MYKDWLSRPTVRLGYISLGSVLKHNVWYAGNERVSYPSYDTMDKCFRFVRFRRMHLICLVVFCLLLTLATLPTSYSPSSFYYAKDSELQTFDSIATVLKRDTVVTDIKIKKCLKYSSCDLSKQELASNWQKIALPLELYPNGGLVQSIDILKQVHYVFVKMSPLSKTNMGLCDVKIVSNIERDFTPNTEDADKWVKTECESFSVWKKRTFKASDPKAEDQFLTDELIRSVEVLYGMDDLADGRPNWELQPEPILAQEVSVLPHLSLLKVSVSRQAEVVKEYDNFAAYRDNQVMLTSNSKVKILQISDLHLGPDTGKCASGVEGEICHSDAATIQFLETSLNREKDPPVDLVIITGDLIDSYRTKDFKSTILKGLSLILERRIPFVFTFGELDENSPALDREKDVKANLEGLYLDRKIDPNLKLSILSFISSLPMCYNVFTTYSRNIHGLTNNSIRIHRTSGSSQNDIDVNKPDVVISLLDSENHKIDASQMNHLYRYNQEIKTEQPFKLLFFHYPLPNYRPRGSFKIIGSFNQKDPLNVKTDTKFRDDISKMGYHVVSVGHEHENDACILSERKINEKVVDDLWLCYNSGTGTSAQTFGGKFDRKLRVFEVDFGLMRMLSWKRSETTGEAFDYQNIYQYEAR